MDFKSLLTAPLHAGSAVVRDLMDNPDQADAKQQVLDMLGGQIDQAQKKFVPPDPASAPKPFPFSAPEAVLNEHGKNMKAQAEANGEPFQPDPEKDYTDPDYGRKMEFWNNLQEYEKELQANSPHIDYSGIMKQRLADIAGAPEEHRTNPLYLFAMGMGNPEHAAELVKTHNQAEADANEKQAKRWNELLDTKQQALEGAIKQAMAEGDQKKIIAGKWLEGLAQIEKDRAAVNSHLAEIGARNQGALDRANVRGRWAYQASQQRTNAMIQSRAHDLGLKADSSVFRSIKHDQMQMAQNLMRYGHQDPEDAYDQAEQWAEDQLQKLQKQTGNTPIVGAGGGTTTPPPNPIEARIQQNRGGH